MQSGSGQLSVVDNVTSEICVDFGGLGICFRGSREHMTRWVPTAFHPFATEGEPVWIIDLELEETGRELGDEPVEVRELPDGFVIRGGTYLAQADLARRRARIRGPLAVYPLATTLRHLLPLIMENTILVHGALLAEGGRAWLCYGPSGAGKSSLVGMVPHAALCDEMVAVRCVEGEHRACSLPFWQARPGGGVLAGAFCLHHAPSHRRVRLSPARAVRSLARHMHWPVGSAALSCAAFDGLHRLVETTPVWNLHFALRADVWDVISRQPGIAACERSESRVAGGV